MKIFIGALVAGIIIFICQFLSWTVFDTHRPAQEYTPKQDSILAYLNTQFDSSGGYYLPNTPGNASWEEMNSAMEKSVGKPWAQLYYHKSMDANMGINMVKNLIANVVLALFFCWIVAGYTYNSFGKTFIAAILTGLIIFLHGAYPGYIWYETFDISAFLFDYVVSWALAGLWLAWWLNRKKVNVE